MTPNDIIALALKEAGVVGVGQTPAAEDTQDAFTKLQFMLSQWAAKRWLVYHLVDVSVTSTGAASYSVGPAGSFVVPRQSRIEDAYARYVGGGTPVDRKLTIIQAREDWDRIPFKAQVGLPAYAFLDSAWPTGTLYLWPIPAAGLYDIHLVFKDTLTTFTALTDDINLPPEYAEPILYNLAVRLRVAYRMPPDPAMMALARAGLNTVRGANAQVPVLLMPQALRQPGAYNVYIDQ